MKISTSAIAQLESEAEQKLDEQTKAIVTRLQAARRDLDLKAQLLAQTASELKNHCRRLPDPGAHISFASAHLRLAGAFIQGVKRTEVLDRLLINADRERQEEKARIEADRKQREIRTSQRYVDNLAKYSDTAFEDLYGEMNDGQ